MALKDIPDPGFSGDDGSADPGLAAALAAWADDPSTEPAVWAALATARLLVPVVAVLGEVEQAPVEQAPVEQAPEKDPHAPGRDPHAAGPPRPGEGAGAAEAAGAAAPGGTVGAAGRSTVAAQDPTAPQAPGGAVAGQPPAQAARHRGGTPAVPLRREKTSDMAMPTLHAPGGRRALPVFTSTDALRRWRADARPQPVPLHRALAAAAQEGADTVVLDLAGPVPYQLTGPALRALAEGRATPDPLADPAVAEALRTVLLAEPGVVRAHLTRSADTDGTLALALAARAAPHETVRRVAGALAADAVLRERLVRGLDLALLPPDAVVPGEPLFRR